MRIAIDCRLYSQTGVGRYIRAILTALRKEDTETQENEYFLIVYKSDLKYFVDYLPNIKIIATSAKWHSFKEQFAIPHILYENKIDLVHFPYFNAPIFYFGKFIVTIHDLTINKFKTGKATSLPKPLFLVKKLFYLLTIWLAVMRASLVLTVSETVKKEIIETYWLEENKVRVVYNGGELEEWAEKQGDRGRKGNWGKYILYVGNLHPHKNVGTLILAYDALIKEKSFQDIQVVIVSPFDFFYQKLFSLIEKLNLEKRIKFTGLIDNKKLADYYSNACCFVFPSLSEGFGIPGIEAMNHGCSVIASDIPVFHEIYQDAVMYFNPKNAIDLKEKMVELVKNESLRKEMINRGRIQTSKYSWEKMGRETISAYQNVICKL